jgi:hypothetical protein
MTASFIPEATAEHVHAISLDDRCRSMIQAGR